MPNPAVKPALLCGVHMGEQIAASLSFKKERSCALIRELLSFHNTHIIRIILHERVIGMSEQMLVTQALDERDLLVKKINDKINNIKLVDFKKRNEEKFSEQRITPEEFAKNAASAYQQIMDLIDRYQRLDAAIVASNAANWIDTSYGKFTLAGAIALRNRLKGKGIYLEDAQFEERLKTRFDFQRKASLLKAEQNNKNLEAQAENMRLSILGKDAKVKEAKPLEVVDAYVRENTTEVIDPLESEKKIQEIQEKIDTLLKELDTQIKVSNATHMIEF